MRVAALIALVLMAVSGFPAEAGVETLYRVGSEWRSWTFETRSGDVTLRQWQLPISVSQIRGPWRATAEVAFTSNDVDAPGLGAQTLSGLSHARLRLQRKWNDGRLWTFVEGHHSGLVSEVDPDELELVEILEHEELSLLFNSRDFGDQYRGGLVAQIVQRPNLLLQLGTEFRWRSSYVLRADGLEVDPGEEFRLGLSVDHELGGVLWRHGLWRELFGETDLDGNPGYSTGARWRWQSQLQKSMADFETGADLSLLWTEDGELATDRFLDGSSLRSGNRLVAGIWFRRPHPTWIWTASLRTTQFRGFAGSLGHSGRVVPGLSVARRVSRGQLQLDLDMAYGSLRGEETISGFGLSLSWTQGGGGS